MDIKEEVQEIRRDLRDFKEVTQVELSNISKELAIYNEQLKTHIAGVNQNREALVMTQQHMERQYEAIKQEISLKEKELENKLEEKEQAINAKLDPVVKHVDGVDFTYKFILKAAGLITALGVISGFLYAIFGG